MEDINNAKKGGWTAEEGKEISEESKKFWEKYNEWVSDDDINSEYIQYLKSHNYAAYYLITSLTGQEHEEKTEG
jgi:hypothetical protein